MLIIVVVVVVAAAAAAVVPCRTRKTFVVYSCVSTQNAIVVESN